MTGNTEKIPVHEIRAQFARALSAMYAKEVPLYQTLVDTVRGVNREVLGADPSGELARVTEERHGAIRLGKPEEMKTMARLFAVMGMHPVDYYDLTIAGLPIHSTAFRPLEESELAQNPFRVFTSLLKMDILEQKHPDEAGAAKELLGRRQIFSPDLMALIKKSEAEGGLTGDEAQRFIAESMKTFRWHEQAAASKDTYEALLKTDALLADIACFQGPHINHLTPRVLDIDLLYQRMAEQGIAMIPAIQGPPKMDPDILLRQTSFQALVEPTRFPGGQGSSEGKHRARFGEIEQRGVALTPQGRALYDEAIGRVEARAKQKDPQYRSVLEEEFAAFPRGAETLRRQGLAYFTYRATPEGKAQGIALKGMPLDQLVARGFVAAAPITYEDFLPVSAAGIFKSNLVDGGTASVEKSQKSSRAQMEHIIGAPIADPFALYAAQEARSLGQAYQALGLSLSTAQQQQLRLAEEADPVRRKAGGQTP